MREKKNMNIPSQGGMIQDFVMRVKLILRLLRDRRVSFWLKVIPIAGVVYLVVPVDIIPELPLGLVGELDDAAILGLTSYFFLELCPPEILKQHVEELTKKSRPTDSDEVVDADSVQIREHAD
jgi:uncharacterized membrane protein YkvA (DUF1232 family)